jgi:ribosome biogenesis GTPase
VDLKIGDRRSGCRGQMEPIAISVRYKDEWAIVHRCQKCQVIRTNRVAGDDNELTLLALAVRPLARVPFPLDMLERVGGKQE